MSKKMIYNFTVPVVGQEHFSVVAESYEEALWIRSTNVTIMKNPHWMILIGILDLENLKKYYHVAMLQRSMKDEY